MMMLVWECSLQNICQDEKNSVKRTYPSETIVYKILSGGMPRSLRPAGGCVTSAPPTGLRFTMVNPEGGGDRFSVKMGT